MVVIGYIIIFLGAMAIAMLPFIFMNRKPTKFTATGSNQSDTDEI